MCNGNFASIFLTALLVAVMVTVGISATVSAQSPYADAVGASNPVGWWRMDDASDQTGNHTSSASGGISFDQPGAIAADASMAAASNGTDATILVDDAADLNYGASGDFSIVTWVKRPSGSPTSTIVNKGDSAAGYWLRMYDNGSFKLLLDYGATYDALASSTGWNDDRWHQVVAVADRDSSLRIYVDGVLDSQQATTPASIDGGNVSSPSMPFQIGGMGTHRYDSTMDEFAVYGGALGAERIKDHYELGVGIASGSYSAAVAADTPAGWWRMDDASDQTGTHTGTAGTGIAFDQAGAIAGDTSMAAAFDDVSELAVDDATDLNFGTDEDFTIEAWVKHSGGFSPIVNKGDSANGYWLRFESDGQIRFLLDYGSTASYARSSQSYDDGQWHHVVGVADRDESMQLYVDGELVAEQSLSSIDISSPGQQLQIGQLNGGTRWDGPMDEFAVYDYALDDDQILAQYQAAVPEPSSLLLLFAGAVALLIPGRNRK